MRPVVFAVLLPALFACAPPAPDSGSVSLPPRIERVLRDYERAWGARDADALADLFAEDGYVLSNGRPPVRGRVAIREAYAGAGGPLWLRPLTWSTEGGLGYVVGMYGHEPGGPATGKFVLVLRRKGAGPWLIAADIDNAVQ